MFAAPDKQHSQRVCYVDRSTSGSWNQGIHPRPPGLLGCILFAKGRDFVEIYLGKDVGGRRPALSPASETGGLSAYSEELTIIGNGLQPRPHKCATQAHTPQLASLPSPLGRLMPPLLPSRSSQSPAAGDPTTWAQNHEALLTPSDLQQNVSTPPRNA